MSKKGAKKPELASKQPTKSNPAQISQTAKFFQTYQRELIICGVILLINLIIFGQALGFPFINYDDDSYVFNNKIVQTGLNKESLRWAFTTFTMGHWHPLTWISYLIDAQLFGIKPAAFHFTNLLIHTVNSLLVFLLLRYLTSTVWRSAIVAALFAIHPLHVESVIWIASRKDLLSTMFALLTIFAYARYVKGCDDSSTNSSNWPYYLLTILFFAFGLMSKAMLITLPFVLLLLDLWPLNRLTNRQEGTAIWRVGSQLLLEKLPLFAMTALCIKLAIAASYKGLAVIATAQIPGDKPKFLAEGNLVPITAASKAYIDYLLRTFFPFDLSIYYPYEPYYTLIGLAVSSLILLAISIYVVLQLRQHPYLFVGWCWFLGMMVPVARLVQADRYTYITHIGLFIMLVWGAGIMLQRWQQSTQSIGIMVSVVLVFMMVLCWSQVQNWRDSYTLFKHSVDVTRDNLFMYFNLGIEYERLGRLNESQQAYEQALKLNPDYDMAHLNLGNILSSLNKPQEAEKHYQRAVKLMPESVEAHYNYGKLLAQQNKLDEAIIQLTEAINRRPDFAEAYNNLGGALFTQGKIDPAYNAITKALSLKPDNPEAHYNLACIYFTKENYPAAGEQYRETLRLKPTFAEAHYFLGLIAYKQGNTAEALKRFQEALRIKPSFQQAQASIMELQQKMSQ